MQQTPHTLLGLQLREGSEEEELDEVTLKELYLPDFKASFQASSTGPLVSMEELEKGFAQIYFLWFHPESRARLHSILKEYLADWLREGFFQIELTDAGKLCEPCVYSLRHWSLTSQFSMPKTNPLKRFEPKIPQAEKVSAGEEEKQMKPQEQNEREKRKRTTPHNPRRSPKRFRTRQRNDKENTTPKNFSTTAFVPTKGLADGHEQNCRYWLHKGCMKGEKCTFLHAVRSREEKDTQKEK